MGRQPIDLAGGEVNPRVPVSCRGSEPKVEARDLSMFAVDLVI